MKKIAILLCLILCFSAIFFIPVTQQQTIPIKTPFINIYGELSNGSNWETWRPDLKKILINDPTKISVVKDSNSFVITYPNGKLDVKTKGNAFVVNESVNNSSTAYAYNIFPDKNPKLALLEVSNKISIAAYLAGMFKSADFSDTHADDLKKFIETDSLFYGCYIFRTKVSGQFMIEFKKAVPTKVKFTEAASMLATLRAFREKDRLVQVKSIIAQFLPYNKDSTQVNVGMYIDREVKLNNRDGMIFVRMPVNGPIYAAKYQGKFNKRQTVYNGLRHYFTDHLYQKAILPFDSFLDDKLPQSDTSKVNIQVNFTTFF